MLRFSLLKKTYGIELVLLFRADVSTVSFRKKSVQVKDDVPRSMKNNLGGLWIPTVDGRIPAQDV